MANPILSIIMPVYNTERYVGEAIQSILNQTFKNFELIIIEDGSTDNSLNEINTFRDERIKLHINKGNKGIVYSRNKGLKLAKGEYIGMFDSDDIAYPSKFEKQIIFLEENKNFGMIGTWAKFIDGNSKRLPGKWKLNASPEMIPSIMLFKNYFLQSAVLYRKECIANLSFKTGFDILEDYLIWIEVLNKFKAWNLPQFLVNYRIHSEGVTKKHTIEKRDKEKKLFTILIKELGINPSDTELELHLLIKENNRINKIGTLINIEDWLLKLSVANKNKNIYSPKMYSRVLFNRWLKVCFKARGLHVKMLSQLIKSDLTKQYCSSYFTNT